MEGLYRLGKREENKVRPLLVRFCTEDLKKRVMRKAKELKFADDKFKGITLAHDLTPRQRAQVKEVRSKAMDDLRAEQQNDSDGGHQGNYRIIVVGQTTGNKSSNSRICMGFTCIYVNTRCLVNKIDYLCSEVKVIDADIVGVSESWTNESIGDEEVGLEGCDLFRRDMERAVEYYCTLRMLWD